MRGQWPSRMKKWKTAPQRQGHPGKAIGEMDTHSTDKLIGGALAGAIVTAVVVVVLRYLGFPSGRYDNVVLQAAVPILVAGCLLLTRPLLFRTVLRSRRDPLLLDQDLNSILTGRTIGLIGGFFIEITLCTEIL